LSIFLLEHTDGTVVRSNILREVSEGDWKTSSRYELTGIGPSSVSLKLIGCQSDLGYTILEASPSAYEGDTRIHYITNGYITFLIGVTQYGP
jgi:hypothetical protein